MRDLLGGAQQDPAGPLEHARFDARGDHVHQRVVQVLPVAAALLVPDHEVGRHALHAPVGVRLHRLARELQVRGVADLHHHDRQVARDRVRPKARLRLAVARDERRVRAQRRMAVEDASEQPSVGLRLGLADVDLAERHLAVRPGQVDDAVGEVAVAVLVREVQAVLAVGADAHHEVEVHGLLGQEPDAVPDRDDRVEHRARAAGELPLAIERRRTGRRSPPADEARAVGLEGGALARAVVHGQQVEHPGRRLVRAPRPPRADDRVARGDDLGLHEQLAEGGMEAVGDRGRQHHLGVARHLDRARDAAAVGDARAAELDVVLGRDHDLGVRLPAVQAPAEFDAGLGEDRLVGLVGFERGLERRRPDPAACGVAEIAEGAPGVAGRILAPARERDVAPAAVTAAGAGQHHLVAAVAQHLHRGRARIGAVEHAQRHGGRDAHVPCVDQRRIAGGLARDARHALLQQQQRRLHLRIGLEAALHRTVEQHVRDRQQAHALVVGHERAHQRVALPGRHARRGVVDRLVVAVAREHALLGQALQVRGGLVRRRQQGERARVGRDDELLREPALQAEPRHPERAVLVVLPRVGEVVAALRHAPRHVALASVVDLPRDGGAPRVLEQGARVRRHHEVRHQVLEHRAAP